VHFESTTDFGKTWKASPAINDGTNIAAIQPSILFHPPNRLESLGRTKQERIFEVWSDDLGKTWQPMKLTSLPNPNSGTDAVNLADGRFLLVYNHNPNPKGRSPLNVAVSADGEDWKPVLVLEREPNAQFSYPAVIQTRDGLVHITYTWKRLRIRHVVLDPSKFIPGKFVNGDWPVDAVKN
jgi:predicted neuraminidase